MPADSLTARANTGAGTDTLAGKSTANGFVGAVMLTDASGNDVAIGNPLPVSAAALPLPTGAATESTQATLLTTSAFQARTPALGQAAMAASSPVVISSDQTVIPVNQSGTSTSGSLAALNATVVLSLNGATGFAVDLRGTFTATVTFQGTIDGANWFNLAVIPAGSGVNIASVTTATAAGAWIGNGNGMLRVRANATAYTSGTVNVTIRAMLAAGMVTNLPAGATTQAVSGTVTANIGTGSIAAGTNAIGDVGTQYRGSSTGAASIHHVVAAATTNALNIKAAAGRVAGWCLSNTTASWRYVKLHNTAGAPTAGSGVVATIGLPPNGTVTTTPPGGIGFATGIARTVVTGAADTDATATAANDVVGDIYFA